MIWLFSVVHLTPRANAKSNFNMPCLNPCYFKRDQNIPKQISSTMPCITCLKSWESFHTSSKLLTHWKSSQAISDRPAHQNPWECWRKRAAAQTVISRENYIVAANWEWSSCLCKISSLGLNNYTDSATQTQSTDKTQTKSNISSARYTFSYRHVSQWSKNRGVQHDPTLHPYIVHTWIHDIQYINISISYIVIYNTFDQLKQYNNKTTLFLSL